MKKKLLLTLSAAVAAFSSYGAIIGSTGICMGSTTTLYTTTDSSLTTGVSWSSSNVAVATVSSPSPGYATVTGISAGTATISFTGPSGTYTTVVTVDPTPTSIAGGGSPLCTGSSITLTATPAGGTWSSASPSVATVTTTTGVVTGAGTGTTSIYYTLGTGCSTSVTVTVTGVPAVDSVTGPSSICVGSTSTYTCATPGGSWSSSAPSVASVSGPGVVVGMTAGTAYITYTVPGSCGLAGYSVRMITVSSTTMPATLTTVPTIAVGGTGAVSASIAGGTWSSSTPSVATVSASGVVTGVSAGTATISYETTGCGGPAWGTTVVTVSSDCISGNVLFSSGPAVWGNVKVWLIKYNPTTHILYAVDSLMAPIASGTAHYQFCGMGSDSFRVKAAYMDSILAVGYLPTYHTASSYWNTANVINHTAGVADAGKDINMGYGTTTSGPGFIAGDVTTGANKGTADGSPVAGMLVFCVNESTGAIMQQAVTNNLGQYSFSNLPTGVAMRIYPEAINYATTAYAGITLTSSAPSMTVADFTQHTLSMTITPKTTATGHIAASDMAVRAYPNPATESLTIAWNNVINGTTGTASLTDVTGRRVLETTIDMRNNSGMVQLSTGKLPRGVYMLQVTGSGNPVTSRVSLQ